MKYATVEERKAAKREHNRECYRRKRAAMGMPVQPKQPPMTREEINAKQRAYYAAHKEEAAAKLRQWRAEHPEEYAAQKKREQAQARLRYALKREERQKIEDEQKRLEKWQADEAWREKLNEARANQPENGPWFREWCEERGLTLETAQEKAGLGMETFSYLWDGGRTIPSLALVVGHNLGMSPWERSHLGIIIDRTIRDMYEDAARIERYNPEHFELDWWRRVADYPADKVLASMGRRAQAVEW